MNAERTAALMDELAARNAEHASEYYILVNDEELVQLAAGFCPKTVQAMAYTMAEWDTILEQRAKRS